VTVDPRTGRAVYTPADDYFTPAGEAGDRFVFRAVNSSGESRRGTAVVNVTPPPGTCDNAQPATTPYQTPVEIELPCQGNEIYLEIEDPPGHGTLGEIDQDTKKVTYTPNENYFTATGADPDTFTFTATNRGGKAEPRTATVTVLPPPPTCEPAKPVQTQNRTPVEIKLDCKGDAPELEIVDQPEHGTLGDIDQENGTVTYTPDDDYFTPEGGEPDRFTFRASNRGGAGEPVPATIEVFPPKGTCEDTEATTPYRTAVDVKLPCKGDELEFEITKQPEHGKLGEIDQENGTVTYTPDEDSFTATGADPDTFSFTASNRGGKADARTATVTVLPPVPECKAVGPVQTDNQTPVTVRLECTGDDPRISIVDPPQHGTLGDIDQQNGTVTYTPNDDYFTPKDGEPDRFTFRASNRGGDGDPVAATVDVLPPKPACTPAEPVTTPFQTPADVTLKCTGPELVREIVDQPQHGKLGDVDQGKGTVQYTPDEGYYTPKDGQPDQFTYRATNRAGASDAVAAQVTTLPDRPTCTDAEPAKTPSGTAVTIKLPCEGVDIQWKIVNQPNNGTLGDIDQNAGTVVYTPKQGYFTPRDGQPDRFTFRATNRAGDSGAAAAAVTVEPPAPTCEALSTDTRYETAKAITPKCTAPESEFAIKTQPGHGKLSDLDPATGAVRYTPDKGYYSPLSPVTPDTFTLTATNRTGSADVKVSIRVLPPPATCEAVSKKGNYAKDIALDLKCTGPALKSIEVAGQPGNGKVSLGSPSRTNQTLTVPATYTPNAKFVGDDTFTFAGVSDPGGRGPVATGSVTIEPFKFRAIGDSVTAGFGYYSDGSSMGLLSLFKCKPGEIPNDRCSSNSTLGDNAGDTTPKYSSDWGFGNQVSWAAQYAKRLNLKPGTNFKNLAVTGSEPVNWAKGNGTKEENDYLNKTLEQVVADNPDMTVMTLGANPLLSMFLLGEQRFECSWKLSEAALKACLDKYVNQVKLDDRLTKIYNRLLDAPDNRVVVSLYPTVIPAVAVQPPLISYWPNQLEYMEIEINKRIESIVNKVKQSNPPARANRIFVSKPERTYIGLNSNYVTNQTCGVDFLHAKTDGSSRQAGIAQGAIVTQVALHAAPAFSWLVFPPAIAAASYTYAMTQFCPSGTYWTIEGDTGIHPSKAGYTVMADALQKVANDNKLVPPLP
jgi:lysophospholipase L1-like esterase